mgnify:CR=1 FL=1
MDTRSGCSSLHVTAAIHAHSTAGFLGLQQQESSSCVISKRSSLTHSRLLTRWHQRGYSHEHAAEKPVGLCVTDKDKTNTTRLSKEESLSESSLISGWIALVDWSNR